MIWYVLLLLFGVGMILVACDIESRKGFFAAAPWGIPGLVATLLAFFLYIAQVFLPLVGS
jgi:hypothetical protein